MSSPNDCGSALWAEEEVLLGLSVKNGSLRCLECSRDISSHQPDNTSPLSPLKSATSTPNSTSAVSTHPSPFASSATISCSNCHKLFLFNLIAQSSPHLISQHNQLNQNLKAVSALNQHSLNQSTTNAFSPFPYLPPLSTNVSQTSATSQPQIPTPGLSPASNPASLFNSASSPMVPQTYQNSSTGYPGLLNSPQLLAFLSGGASNPSLSAAASMLLRNPLSENLAESGINPLSHFSQSALSSVSRGEPTAALDFSAHMKMTHHSSKSGAISTGVPPPMPKLIPALSPG